MNTSAAALCALAGIEAAIMASEEGKTPPGPPTTGASESTTQGPGQNPNDDDDVEKAAKAQLTGVLRARALQQAGFSTEGVPIILDENLAGRGVAEALRAQGYNVRSSVEIFGSGAKDPAIKSLAESIGARVLTADRGRQIGQGFGNLAIRVPGQVGQDVSSIVRLLDRALK